MRRKLSVCMSNYKYVLVTAWSTVHRNCLFLLIKTFPSLLPQQLKCCFTDGQKPKKGEAISKPLWQIALSGPMCCPCPLHYIFPWIWFCPKGSGAWWVSNQRALSGLSLYVVRPSLMCAAVNTGSSLPTTVSWGMRLSTRKLMSTLEGSHRRKMLQL